MQFSLAVTLRIPHLASLDNPPFPPLSQGGEGGFVWLSPAQGRGLVRAERGTDVISLAGGEGVKRRAATWERSA